jgi:hypothetical protein
MADSTNLSVFGQETYFNEKINAFNGIETTTLNATDEVQTPTLNATQQIETPKITITQQFNGVSITASNAYGTRYVSIASTPSNNSVGDNGDVWYTI